MNREELNKKFNVTEEQLDTWADEYENDTFDEGSFGKVVLGRPRFGEEKLISVTFKISPSSLKALDNRAKERGESRSEALRAAADMYSIA